MRRPLRGIPHDRIDVDNPHTQEFLAGVAERACGGIVAVQKPAGLWLQNEDCVVRLVGQLPGRGAGRFRPLAAPAAPGGRQCRRPGQRPFPGGGSSPPRQRRPPCARKSPARRGSFLRLPAAAPAHRPCLPESLAPAMRHVRDRPRRGGSRRAARSGWPGWPAPCPPSVSARRAAATPGRRPSKPACATGRSEQASSFSGVGDPSPLIAAALDHDPADRRQQFRFVAGVNQRLVAVAQCVQGPIHTPQFLLRLLLVLQDAQQRTASGLRFRQ